MQPRQDGHPPAAQSVLHLHHLQAAGQGLHHDVLAGLVLARALHGLALATGKVLARMLVLVLVVLVPVLRVVVVVVCMDGRRIRWTLLLA